MNKKRLSRLLILTMTGAMLLPEASFANGDALTGGIGSITLDLAGTEAATEAQTDETTASSLPIAGIGTVDLTGSDDALSAISAGIASSFLRTTSSSSEEHPSVRALESRLEANSDLYKNLAICQCEGHVNIREEADASSEILGKISNKAAAYIKEIVTNESGTWYRVKSGSVTGYIKSDYFAVNEDAVELAKKYGTLIATVNTSTLRLHAEASLESETLTTISDEEKYEVIKEDGDFLKLQIDDDLEGWVSREYVTLKMKFTEAISIEEEKAEEERLAKLAAERKAAEEKARQESIAASKKAKEASQKAAEASKAKETTKSTTSSHSSDYSSVSSKRKAICAYAESFVGKLDYVHGGTSLSSGVDCSGFVQQIYKKYGISLPRCSDDQGYCGESVSLSEARPGDLVYYGGHIAIYIGDNTVVHASSPSTGVKYSTVTYRSIKRIANVIGD